MKEGINTDLTLGQDRAKVPSAWGAWWCAGLGAVVALGLAWFWPQQTLTPMIAVQTWFLATLAVLGREAVVLGGRERGQDSGLVVGPDYRARFWPHLYLPGVVLILSGLDGCWRLGQAGTPSSFTLAFSPWMVAVVEATLVVLLALALRHKADLLRSKVGSPQDPEKPSPNNAVPKQELIPKYDPDVINEWEKVRKESPLSGDSDMGTASHPAWRTQNENQP